MVMQCVDIRALYDGKTAKDFCRLLRAEIIGQFDYKELHGGFPVEQADFVRAYLMRAESAIYADFGVSREAS
jgi:hypothetical protein